MESRSCPIHTLVTHPRPHLDEMATIWGFQRWGENPPSARRSYPGAQALRFEPFAPDVHADGRDENEWLGEGYLFIGVRRGMFDDHPHERFPHDCAFTLMLKHLGVHEDPALSELQRHVLTSDRRGSPHPLHLETMIKTCHRFLDLPTLIRMSLTQLECFYLAQSSFFEAINLVRAGRHVSVRNEPSGSDFLLVFVENTDNEDISRAARAKEHSNAALVVVRNTKGQYYVSGNDRLGTRDVSRLAETVRIAEQEEAGKQVVNDRQRLQSDGVLPEVPEWYHQREAGLLLNGSLTAPHVPPSKIPPETVLRLCEDFLSR